MCINWRNKHRRKHFDEDTTWKSTTMYVETEDGETYSCFLKKTELHSLR